jgi:hypothetical protein
MKNFMLIASFLTPILLVAQKHDNIWLYGKKSDHPDVDVTKIDFSSGSPAFIPTDFEGTFVAFSSSMSDTAGNLLFYTNGCHLYDASGKIMENGDTLNSPPTSYWRSHCTAFTPGFKQNQGAFALPRPGSNTLYDLFHMNLGKAPAEPPGLISLLRTVVDMDTPDGLGKATEKDVPLLAGETYEPAAAVRHGNGRDWWIVLPNAQTSKPVLYRYLLTPEGLLGPYLQEGAFQVIDSLFYGGAQVLTFTPDGKKLIQYHIYYGFIAYDFDRCTGLISNPVRVLSPVKYNTWEGIDVEVSPNSRFVYVIMGKQRQLVQYDLHAPDVALSGDTVAVYDGFEYNQNPIVFGTLERGPDGKIYIVAGCCFHMHVIESPDLEGAACDVRQHSVELPTWIYASLPYFPNYRLYDLPDSPCDTLGINGPTVSVAPQPEPPPALRLYPNPATDQVRVLLPAPAPPGAEVLLTDVAGRMVVRQPLPAGAAEALLSVAQYSAGLYIVRVQAAGAVLGAGRVSVVR